MYLYSAHICNTSPLKEKFWLQNFVRFFLTHTHNNSKVGTMYNLYKLTNYKHTNYTLNTASRQGVSVRMPYFTF